MAVTNFLMWSVTLDSAFSCVCVCVCVCLCVCVSIIAKKKNLPIPALDNMLHGYIGS